MEWFKSKAGQLIALATIVSTLAGFGYAGAGYVNRLENLEKKIGGLGETEDAQQVIEQRFATIETSVEYLEKEIDGIDIPDNNDKLSNMKASIASLTNDVERILSDIEKLEDGNKKSFSKLTMKIALIMGGLLLATVAGSAFWVNSLQSQIGTL